MVALGVEYKFGDTLGTFWMDFFIIALYVRSAGGIGEGDAVYFRSGSCFCPFGLLFMREKGYQDCLSLLSLTGAILDGIVYHERSCYLSPSIHIHITTDMSILCLLDTF